MIVLSEKQVRKLMPLDKIGIIIKRVEKAFADYSRGMVQMPPKAYLYFPEYGGDLRIMPSYSASLKMAGTKIVNVHPENPRQGLPTVMASIMLNDPATGEPEALMDGSYLTGMRTGAAGAVAVKYLARRNAAELGVVGAGVQAIFQIAAISSVRKLKDIVVYGRNPKAVRSLITALEAEGIKVRGGSIEEACGRPIVVTVTPVRKPIVKKEWIRPGTHINAIGADAAGKEELDPRILKSAKIVIDDWAQASHSGEINVPLRKGLITRKNIWAGLGDVVAGKKAGRTDDNEITVFDSTGLGVQDLYTAAEVLKLARRAKVGREIALDMRR
jgi:alanine dehydrogenase